MEHSVVLVYIGWYREFDQMQIFKESTKKFDYLSIRYFVKFVAYSQFKFNLVPRICVIVFSGSRGGVGDAVHSELHPNDGTRLRHFTLLGYQLRRQTEETVRVPRLPCGWVDNALCRLPMSRSMTHKNHELKKLVDSLLWCSPCKILVTFHLKLLCALNLITLFILDFPKNFFRLFVLISSTFIGMLIQLPNFLV